MSTARAELAKLLTLPAVVLTVALIWAATALITLAPGAGAIPYVRGGFAVLGVLAATSEYDGGQIRTTLVCTPRRLHLQAVKALTLAALTTPVALVTVLIAGAGNPAYLVLVTLLGAAAGTLLRHALAAAGAVLSWYYVLGPLLADRVTGSLWLPAAWVAAALPLAGLAFARRDAA